jgi:hypothetical protein
MRWLVGIVFVLCLVACDGDDKKSAGSVSTTTASPPATTEATTKELSEQSRLRLDGIGPVRVGMTLQEASRAVGRDVYVDPDSLIEEDSLCGFAEVRGGPADLLFMVSRESTAGAWKILRVDVIEESRIATGAGIRIRATEDQVKQAYGPQLRVEPHEYLEGGHYLILDVDGEGGFMLLLETDGTEVTQFRSGNDSAVRAPEGCL